MPKDLEVKANDLRIYFKGFEIALQKGNTDDAIGYLENVRIELNNTLQFLMSTKKSESIQ